MGSGLPRRDFEKAIMYFTKAAEMEDENAMFQMGMMYLLSEGVE